jgi:hypothetical protein
MCSPRPPLVPFDGHTLLDSPILAGGSIEVSSVERDSETEVVYYTITNNLQKGGLHLCFFQPALEFSI